jgi:hypothetical protein
MVMATCGTFDYTFVVPEGPRGGRVRCRVRSDRLSKATLNGSSATRRSFKPSNTPDRNGSCSVESP